MTADQRPPPGQDDKNARQMLGPGIAFLSCGFTFLVVGLAMKIAVFAIMAPAFVALGIVFLVRARQRPDGGDQR